MPPVCDALTPAQCRAARALLNWSQEDLVRRSGTTRKIVADFDRGATRPHPRNMARIKAAFEAQGIEFLSRNGEGLFLGRKALGKRTPERTHTAA
jgi:transcriptional regulator with XRE-family HTH domain